MLSIYLEKTKVLKELVLYEVLGERPVFVEIKYAKEKRPGFIADEDKGYIRIYEQPKKGEEDMADLLFITKTETLKLEPQDRIMIYQGKD